MARMGRRLGFKVKARGGRSRIVLFGPRVVGTVAGYMKKVRTVEWKNGRVVMLDQRLLPNREVVSAHVRVRGTKLTSHLPVAEASDPP